MKSNVFASHLREGMTLANGNTVTSVAQYCASTVYLESDGTMHDVWNVQEIAVNQETTCMYGGTAPGHSHGFCTSSSCY